MQFRVLSIQSFYLIEIKSWIRMSSQRNRTTNKQGIKRKTSDGKPGPATCFLLETLMSSMKSQSNVHMVKILPWEYHNHSKIRKTLWYSGICACLGGSAWSLTFIVSAGQVEEKIRVDLAADGQRFLMMVQIRQQNYRDRTVHGKTVRRGPMSFPETVSFYDMFWHICKCCWPLAYDKM